MEITMKKLTFTLWLIAIALTTACSGHKKADANSTGNDSISAKTDSVQPYVEEEDTTDYSKFANPPTRIDTTVGDWEIHVREFYEGKKIDYPERYMSYTSLKVSIYKAGKPIFKNYKLNLKSLVGKDINSSFTLSAPQEVYVTPTTVYLSLSYCDEILALDRIYTLAFCANRQTRKVEITNESYEGEYNGYVFDLYNFYAMYVNELAQPQPNPAAIRQVLNKYCTKGFAQKMQSHTIKNNPLLGRGKFQFQWLRSFAVHSKIAKTNACLIHYQTPGGKKVYKLLQLQKKPKSENDFLIDGVSNATENDRPVMDYDDETFVTDNEI